MEVEVRYLDERGEWVTDLTRPLSGESLLTPGKAGGVNSSLSSFKVRVGSRIWLDGHGWEVAELNVAAVRLRGAVMVYTVSLTALAQVTIRSRAAAHP